MIMFSSTDSLSPSLLFTPFTSPFPLTPTQVEYGIPGGAREGHGRFVDVGIFPMGIDVGALRERRREPDVSYWVQLLRQRYAGMMIVVGRDKLDEIQGVRHKLEAFELFLKKWPEYQGKVPFSFLFLFRLLSILLTSHPPILSLLPIRNTTR